MALTDVKIRAAKAPEKLKKITDANGLQLFVKPNGSKLWHYAYRYSGKQKLLALGAYPDSSLGDARTARDLSLIHI